jgi:hypothetical protein
MATRYISRVLLLCQRQSLLRDAAAKHHDFKAIKKHRKHATCVHMAPQPFGFERRAEEAATKRSERLGRFLDARIDVVVI